MNMNKENGVTLLELMTVVAIIGILATMAIPYFHFTPEARVKAAANDIAGILNNARMTAIAKNTSAVIKFNETADSCYFDPANTSSSCEWNGKIDISFPEPSATKYSQQPRFFDVQGPERWVIFNSAGVPTDLSQVDGEESVYLSYKNVPNIKEYRVTVQKFSGKITVEYWDGVSSWVSLY